jgi:hypothetical protein
MACPFFLERQKVISQEQEQEEFNHSFLGIIGHVGILLIPKEMIEYEQYFI